MQPISPYPWTRLFEDHPYSPTPAPRPADPPEPPDLTDFDAEAYATAARSMGVSPIAPNPVLEALGALHHARDAAMQQRLDGFRAQATPTYRTPVGDVRVATPFWLDGYAVHPDKQEELRITCKALKLNATETRVLQDGRGTPAQVQRVTQALIDAYGLAGHTGQSIDERIRRTMFDHGIGMDCAGYTAQAFLASRGIDRAHSQLASVSPSSDPLSNLANRGFARVALDAARPGDIVVLDPRMGERYGHCAIVYAARQATDADKQFLRDAAELAWRDAKAHEASDSAAYRDSLARYNTVVQAAATANLRVLVVDSSWGSDHDAHWGGVERRMWWHDPLEGPWVSTNRAGVPLPSATPYDHPVNGVYRPRAEP